ncbi:DNA polymerase III subunit alpha [Candidatus Peregrinibacteria bacterium CG10_big_fil_rev_8_21_14_0_10_49_24]|nr:MAG: DNA polymerase III subunit alpha [Candidatus Peregrinibacteria bacterium CG11_big_fil_rev_8_21_14_0_20_49_14]PIR50488.1 MAG: DNA polymerase III subunit alpha [Candidatus Peregrinibacteria bacterium CG10_big_fil_rev_8_21_14_0_10_49_24]PJA67704.1 MAG: DNA polymerase III subunit alpha [Candidatus Peregrinibacteria bacterium CG_4_9_14_3_um_filter_49_12]
MKPEDFVHLHCHSTYSLLEALPSPEEVVLRAKELGHSAVGLADKGHTYGLIEFYQYAKKNNIKPILGLETYVAVRSRHDKESGVDTKRYPLVLLASTQKGYENLLQLATKAALEGMYYKPRVDSELLKEFGGGLVALSGPISGAIPQAALAEDGDRITELVTLYQSFFGKENLYFELMDLPNVSGQAEVNQQLIKWGKELSVPLVATCNSHYCRTQDAEAHDVVLCIQKNALVDDPRRFSMRDSDFSMRPFQDLEEAFAHVPEALENTRAIADRCTVDFDFSTYHIPRFPVPEAKDEKQYLRELVEKGLYERYGKPSAEALERMEYELGIIEQMGFSGYFLIVSDFINEAKRRGITVGPGRGSAAGSLVSYCLNITTLDPLEHGLLFERFLNPERISMPDIDVDFADTSRDIVLDYVRDKYGEDHVVQICTFGTLAARAAVKDVGRAYGVPFLEMNTLAKLIPERPGTTLDEALETQELKAAYDSNETYRKIIDTALKLEGKARHVSVHACGVIITEEPTMHYTALQRAPKDDSTVITQSSAKPLEALGLLKMDFLGLTNLTVIQTTLEIIERTRGEKLDIATIPLNDAAAFGLLQRGDTTGVFQLESGGMRRYLKQLKPTQFEDITAMVSLYRPGPMEWIPSFIKRKHGKEKVKYIHDDLKLVLEPTYGIGIYQEQILQIARTFAGYSLGEADLLRKAIGKKIKSELDAQRENFIRGAVEKGYEKKLAEKIFDDVITPFAGYGFNKSHAAGYARIAYETAYLKANYPVQFMAALLSSDAQRTDRVMIEIDECRSMGINVLPPDINESLRHFTAIPDKEGAGGSIRFGLTAIKGIGDSSVQQIIDVRQEMGKFDSIENFARSVPTKVLNKKTIDALAKAGALDSLGERRTLVDHYQNIVDYAKSCGDISSAQTDLFGHMESDEGNAGIEFPETIPASVQEKLQWEKETLGMYVSSHPLAGLRKYVGKKALLIGNLTKKEVGKKIKIAGIQEGVKKITTKKGDTMAIVFFEDPSGKIEVTLFPRTYAEVADVLEKPDSFLVIDGVLDLRAGQLQLRANAIKHTTLSRIIANAKESGFFDEEEAANGMPILKRTEIEDEERVEVLDEEGNVIAGETVAIEKKEDKATDELQGPLSKWIAEGMDTKEVLKKLKLPAETSSKGQKESSASAVKTATTSISVYTIRLPNRAPKKLLLDLKKVLETFPGKERVQLQIGEQIVPLPLTVNISTVLEQKIDEVIQSYSEIAA